MKTKIIVSVSIGLLLFLSIMNLEIMPLRQEISDMEIIMVAGFDKVKDGYEVSFLKSSESSNSEGSNAATAASTSTQVVSSKSNNYNIDIDYLHTTTDKYIDASHIKYYFIGEETAKTDLYHTIDAIARSYQTRLNAKVYIVKGATAKEFIEKASTSEYKIEDKLKVMEKGFWAKNTTADIKILDVGKILLETKSEGVIPVIDFNSRNESSEQEAEIKKPSQQESSVNIKEKPFEFAGLGIIDNMKLVDFLDGAQTKYANYILNEDNATEIVIKHKDTIIVFGIEGLNVEVDFEFENDGKISKSLFEVEFNANYEEVKAIEPVFSYDSVQKYKVELENVIKEQLLSILEKSKEIGVDFLKLEEKLELTHPYKYIKNKANFFDNFKKSKIEIKVNGDIQTTYDIVESNWRQKGETR